MDVRSRAGPLSIAKENDMNPTSTNGVPMKWLIRLETSMKPFFPCRVP